MASEFDANVVAASVIDGLIRDSFKKVARGTTGVFSDGWQKVFEDFSPYMKDAYQRNKYVRILCQKERDVDIEEIYVAPKFESSNVKYDASEIIFKIAEGANSIITGIGGAGKTFFMRKAWLELFDGNSKSVPIFVELRKTNEATELNLKEFIRAAISRTSKLESSMFEYFCKEGRFCFLLDGFDEVFRERSDVMQEQVLQFAADYPKCPVILSSRPDDRFSGWQGFTAYVAQPFEFHQTRELVKKVPFDPSAKEEFLARMDEAFFADNQEFLSNPLLAIMMMMTFREHMDTPKRMNIFYEQAFNTLFQYHDATKLYSRKKSMDIEQFQRSFGMFCLLSYYSQVYEFTYADVIDFIKKSNEAAGIDVEPLDILYDYEKSINLLRQDGLHYVFIHRSFQEYFAALALVRIIPNKFSQVVGELVSRHSDKVVAMCYDMNNDLVIKEYLAPTIEEIKSDGFRDAVSSDRLDMFTRCKIVFTARYGPSTSSRSGVINQMYYQNNVLVGNLVDIVGQLRGGDFGAARIQHVLFGSKMTSIFSSIEGAVPGPATVEVAFVDGRAKVVSVTTDDPTMSQAAKRTVQRAINGQKSLLLLVEAELRTVIDAAFDWCETQMELSGRRSKSLNEVLGLAS